MMVLQHHWNWHRGRLQHRAQSEEVKLRAPERDPGLRVVGWHMQVLAHRTRQAMRVQVQAPGWSLSTPDLFF